MNTPKKIICAVTNDLVSDQRVNKTAGTLQENGYDVLLVGRKLPGSPAIISKPYTCHRFNLPFHKGFLFYASYNIRLFLFLLKKRFDIVISNDLDTLASSFLAAKIKRKRIIYDSHEYYTELPELIHRPFIRGVWQFIEQLILPRIKEAYTVCSPIAEAYKEKYGIDMSVVRNVPLLDTPVIEPEKKIDFPSGKKIIMYQGSVNVGRGIEQVIDAMKYIDNAVFIVFGDGDIKNILKKKCINQHLEEKVIFVDRIPYEYMKYYTLKADIGISLEQNIGLNYYFALPNKLFSYIHAGVPVLVSDFPAMSEIVNKYDIGITTKDYSPQVLSNIITSMLSDEERIKKWKSNLNIAAKELCWEKESAFVLQTLADEKS